MKSIGLKTLIAEYNGTGGVQDISTGANFMTAASYCKPELPFMSWRPVSGAKFLL